MSRILNVIIPQTLLDSDGDGDSCSKCEIGSWFLTRKRFISVIEYGDGLKATFTTTIRETSSCGCYDVYEVFEDDFTEQFLENPRPYLSRYGPEPED